MCKSNTHCRPYHTVTVLVMFPVFIIVMNAKIHCANMASSYYFVRLVTMSWNGVKSRFFFISFVPVLKIRPYTLYMNIPVELSLWSVPSIHVVSLNISPLFILFLLYRPKRIRFFPKNVYAASSEGDMAKVLQMLGKKLKKSSCKLESLFLNGWSIATKPILH